MYLNLRLYLIVFANIGFVFILWYFVRQCFVFNFSNVLSVYLDLRVYLFVLAFVAEVLFRLAVFSRNLLAGDVHSNVTMDRHVQACQWTGSISLLTWRLLWASACSLEAWRVAVFSYYLFSFEYFQTFKNTYSEEHLRMAAFESPLTTVMSHVSFYTPWKHQKMRA